MEPTTPQQEKEKKVFVHKAMVYAIALLTLSLAIGMGGYHFVCELDWYDSFLNACMILTGMGPVDEPESNAGKIFAGIYALYSGIIFLSIVAMMVVPTFHNALHKWQIHREDEHE